MALKISKKLEAYLRTSGAGTAALRLTANEEAWTMTLCSEDLYEYLYGVGVTPEKALKDLEEKAEASNLYE